MIPDDEIDKSGWDIFSRGEADHLTHHYRYMVKGSPIFMDKNRGGLSQMNLRKNFE